MNEIEDVLTLLKSRFSLIEKFELVSSASSTNNKIIHLQAFREDLENMMKNKDGEPQQNFKTWNIFVVRIVEEEEDNSSSSITNILSEITSRIEQKTSAENVERNLLVLEEGGGLNIREIKVVV